MGKSNRKRKMTQADHVLGKFESLAELARLLKLPATTVQGWKTSGNIPGWHHTEILRAARKAGVDLTAEDFSHHLQNPSKRGAQQASV